MKTGVLSYWTACRLGRINFSYLGRVTDHQEKGRLRGLQVLFKINHLQIKQSLICVPLRGETCSRVGDLGNLWITEYKVPYTT
ncbi:Uncharacterised protein [Yersinia intermedia]|uniref:Uncharacterized protein n=1 Tax=Yersinia intermedia TaxID=631 RepID=A0A0H5LRI6_YERIN|nr:Uncharacterised protein [Yersinia intermedia]